MEPAAPAISVVAVPEPVPAAIPVVKMDESTNDSKSLSEDDLIKLRKINFKKKVSGDKLKTRKQFSILQLLSIPGKEKRLRQNRKLFRMLTPRNAIAALNELHGQSVNESIVIPTQG